MRFVDCRESVMRSVECRESVMRFVDCRESVMRFVECRESSHNENLNREITVTLNALQQKLDDQEENIKVITINQKSEGEKLCVIEHKMEKSINSLKGTVGPLERNIKTVLSEVNKSKTSCDQLWKVSVDNKLVMVSSEIEGMSKYIAELKICNTKKIYFSVGINSKKVVPKNDFVKYDTVFTNIGNGYNILTGIFTCPMEGIYVFLVGVLSDRNKYVGLDLYQNTDYKMSVFARENNGYCSTGNSVILHLKLGDQVYLKAKDSSDLYGKPLDIVNTFSGCLSAADEAT
ncbi:Complement C1q-like protein 4 [Bulinus truncatus]|nr:Complement C1q-like protein 4 [Bulinus truncatus]